MEKVILTGPRPTPEEAAQRLGLTRKDRVIVNKVLRQMQKEEPRLRLLATKPKRAISHSTSDPNARPAARRADKRS